MLCDLYLFSVPQLMCFNVFILINITQLTRIKKSLPYMYWWFIYKIIDILKFSKCTVTYNYSILNKSEQCVIINIIFNSLHLATLRCVHTIAPNDNTRAALAAAADRCRWHTIWVNRTLSHRWRCAFAITFEPKWISLRRSHIVTHLATRAH